MNINIFLTTRTGSSRLPNKALMMIGWETVTDVLISRLAVTAIPIIMVTPDTERDKKILHKTARIHMIKYFAGDNTNIIKRHIDCAEKNEVDWIINIDGDDVLACPDVISLVKDTICDKAINADCVYTTGLPLGLNVIAYKPSRLKKVDFSKDTDWGRKILEVDDNRIEIPFEATIKPRLTLDYIEDFFVIQRVINDNGKFADLEEIVKYFKENPAISAINKFRNEEYFNRLANLSK